MVLTAEGPVPIYLQIKYQVSYLITSGQLRVGDRLPTVRELAQRLAVNPGTVAQAYRELQLDGLIESQVGRGSFVAASVPAAPDTAVRQRLAARAAEAAVERLRALALTDSEVRFSLEAALASSVPLRHALLLAPTVQVGHKYAASLAEKLGPGVRLYPALFSDVERRANSVATLLQLCYFVLTFASSVKRVEQALAEYELPTRVLGMSVELQPKSIQRLRALQPGQRVLVFAEERYAHQSLGLVVLHSRLAPHDIELATLEDDPDAPQRMAPGTTIVHTLGTRASLAAAKVGPGSMLELEFDVVPDSVARLRSVLLP